ncbi:MAG: glycosyltransferase WbsX family protein [Chitinophagaceae bacterium]
MQFRPIAIYLPQFHPIPENDEWWGKGFTEWTKVTKAKPLFKGHYQPHLPADLGFYDLRLPEVREQQAQLAKEYGIYGFCYYHYWFNGKRILERPFQEIFESGKPDFPFMLCWANENWTKIWDGGENNILLKQNYSEEDDRLHMRSLIPYFKDKRYIKINNKPVVAIYRSTLLPDPKNTLNIWREEANQQGLELYITRFESFGSEGTEYLKVGFDAAIEFQPHKTIVDINQKLNRSLKKRLYDKLNDKLKKVGLNYNDIYKNQIIDYKKFIKTSMDTAYNKKDYKKYRCVMPGFDNTARKKNDYVLLKGSTPALFETWCIQVLSNFKPYSKEENLFFINAWNEWAEGNHLEPCSKWEHGYLEAFKRALKAFT